MIVAPADPADPPKMAAAGKADLAVSYQPQLHLQVAEGLPLERVGTLVATPLNCLLVQNDGPMEKIADLKGRKVGFSVAGVEEAMLTAMLQGPGLTLDDVELVNVNWSLSPALMSGQVDAVIGAFRNFELNQMAIEGVPGRCFYPEEEGLPTYDELIYVANPASRWTRPRWTASAVSSPRPSGPRSSSSTIRRKAGRSSPAPRRSWTTRSTPRPGPTPCPRFALRPAALDEGRYAAFEKFMNDAGLIDKVLPVSHLAVDPNALPAAGTGGYRRQ